MRLLIICYLLANLFFMQNLFSKSIYINSKSNFKVFAALNNDEIYLLNISGVNIDSLERKFSNTKSINKLGLYNCFGSKYFEVINSNPALKNIKEIVLENIYYDDFNHLFSAFDSLESIRIENCNVESIDFLLKFSRTLKELYISGLKLDSIPDDIGKLDNLEKLLVSNCMNPFKDDELKKFTQLRNLIEIDIADIYGCLDLSLATKLKSVFIDYNSFDSSGIMLKLANNVYPNTVCIGSSDRANYLPILNLFNDGTIRLDSIKEVYLNGCIDKIPSFVMQMPLLETLVMRNCKLTDVDYKWDKLANIKRIDFSENCISTIPQSLINILPRLDELYIRYNLITTDETNKINSSKIVNF